MPDDPMNPPREIATQDPAAPVKQTPTAAKTPAVSGSAGAGGDMEKISSMEDLKKKQPGLYKLVLEGIATTIVNEMRGHQEKIKELMRKAQRDAERH